MENKNNLVKMLIGLVILGAVGFGAYYAIQNSNVKTTTQDTATADWKIYENKDYGFQLTLTDDFINYKTRESIQNDGAKLIWFSIPTSDKKYGLRTGYAEPFAITIYTTEGWKQEQFLVEPHPTEFSSNSSYVFAYSMWADYPADLSNMRDIQKILIDQILPTFKFTK